MASRADDLDEGKWHGVVSSLEDISDYYDAMNSISTFFQADRWRKTAGRLSGKGLDVLEVGCGPGSFLRHLDGRRIVCIDPSEHLLRIAASRARDDTEFKLGEGEHLPTGPEEFDRIFCSFSFRDFKNRSVALKEMHRVLRKGGLLVILDIAKFDSGIRRELMKLHLKRVVPLIARAIIPKREFESWGRNPYDDLWMTYQAFQTPEEIAKMMEEAAFTEVRYELLSLGGAFLITGRK